MTPQSKNLTQIELIGKLCTAKISANEHDTASIFELLFPDFELLFTDN